MISGNMVGSYSQLGRTLTIVDENGEELIGVIVGQETKFTACDNDVREGMIYAGDDGVSTGTKDIPAYYTTQGERVITRGSKFILPIPDYNYTKLQAIICSFNTNLDNSVASEKVVINNNVYDVQSTVVLSTVQKDNENACIDLGITNTSDKHCLMRYFSYKEIY
jgi:hypothetical protein